MKHLLIRPKVSIIVFDNEHKSIKNIVESLSKLPDLMKRLLEFTLVVYDNQVSKETEQDTMSLRRFMKSGFKNYNSKHSNELSYYGVAKVQIEKKPEDIVTEEEIRKLIESNK